MSNQLTERSIAKVAVIMSTYNGEQFVAEQIESILNQKGVSVELFIRDDGSTDSTIDILRRYEKSYSNVHLEIGKNLGYKKSFFSMLFSIVGKNFDFYAFSDQDDFWKPEKLYKGCLELQRITASIPKLYYSNLIVCDQTLHEIRKTTLEKRKKSIESVITRRSIAGCTIVFDQYLYLILTSVSCGYEVVVGSHDNYLVSLCYSVGGEVYCDENSYILYRQHGMNTSGSTNSIRLRIKKELKEVNDKSWSEPILAQSLIDNYRYFIKKDKLKTLSWVSSFSNSFFCRLGACLSMKFTTGDLRLTILGKLKILCNKL